jgi:hypothetical protein
LRRQNEKNDETGRITSRFCFSEKRKNSAAKKSGKSEALRRKKWAEARREEEEDFNLSPWFV